MAKLHDLHLVSTAELGEQIASVVSKALLVGIEGQIRGGVANNPGAAATQAHYTHLQHVGGSQNLQNQINILEQAQGKINIHIENAEARRFNSLWSIMYLDEEQELRPIRRMEDGAIPPRFPKNEAELHACNGQDLAQLLQFYNIPPGPEAASRQRFYKFLGL